MSRDNHESNMVRWQFSRPDALAIVSMFAMGALVYGVYARMLGFYWDDWPVVWVYKALGPRGVSAYFGGQRPLYGWIVANVARICGISPLGWHIASLFVRCASSAVLFVAFSALWPRRKEIAWMLGALVLLYPGFTLQPIALGFLEYHLSFLLFAVSLAATIFSIKVPAWRWLLLPVALITELLSYLVIEYFVGLELFRLFCILIATDRESANLDFKRIKPALVRWIPYAIVWIGYATWRTFIFHTVSSYGTTIMDAGSDVSSILHSPVHKALLGVLIGVHDILMAGFFAWVRPFSPDLIKVESVSAALSWAIAVIVIAIAIYTIRRLTMNVEQLPTSVPSTPELQRIPKVGLLLGTIGIAGASLPFVVSGLSAEFPSFPSYPDRFTLSFMLPASLIMSCLVALSATRRLISTILLSTILFACSVFQVQNGNSFRHEWLTQKSLFWQLAWRAPLLKRGTSIFSDGLPQSLYGNHSAGILNLLYNSDDSAGKLDYFIFDLSQLSKGEIAWAGGKLSYKPGDPISGRVRSFEFRGTTAQSIVSCISPSGTLRIVTQPFADETLRGSVLCSNVAGLSQPGEVIMDASGLPPGPLLKIMGPEPRHEWLYFYQKAELERQLGNWEAVAALGDEAIKKGFKPTDSSEWLPFIDGYARSNRYRTAIDLTNRVLEETPDAMHTLSSLWLRVKNGKDFQNSSELNRSLESLEGKLMLRVRQ